MLSMEEVAGYDQFFGPQEWFAIVTGDWSVMDLSEEEFEQQYGWSA